MKRTIAVGRVEITYDVVELLSKAGLFDYYEEDYDGKGEFDTNRDFSSTHEMWAELKKRFICAIANLDNEDYAVQLLTSTLKTNKNGSLPKNKINSIINFGAVRNYSNSYGSHSFTVDTIRVSRESEFKGTLILDSFKNSESF